MDDFSEGDWEALAEVKFLLEGHSSYDAVVCFCTRSLMKDHDLLFRGMKGAFPNNMFNILKCLLAFVPRAQFVFQVLARAQRLWSYSSSPSYYQRYLVTITFNIL